MDNLMRNLNQDLEQQDNNQIRYPQHSRKSLIITLLLITTIVIEATVGFVFIQRKAATAPQYPIDSNTKFINPQKISEQLKETDNIQVATPGAKAVLPGAKWVPQTFNNCGPATTSMLLQYFGFNVDQNTTKAALRTSSDDKNVFTYEISDYLKTKYNISSKIMINGDLQKLKVLLSNGFYILVEDWLHPNEDIGHDTIIRGFDDDLGVLVSDDSYIGANTIYKYDDFLNKQWKAFNREYMPVYTPDKEPLLKNILGDEWDETIMYQKSVEFNNSQVTKDSKDMYSWFNLGTSYFGLGQYDKAKQAFENSQNLGWPKRMLWYQIQPVQTYNQLGEYQNALKLAQTGLWSNDSFAELHLESAIAYKGLDDTTKAKEEVNKALKYYPNFQKAKDFLSTL